MKWRAAPSARCAEHGLTLGKDGRCALCKRSRGRAARRSGWGAALAAVACALAGAAVVGGRVVVAGPSQADVRAPVPAPRSPRPRRLPATERTAPESSRGHPGAHPGRTKGPALTEAKDLPEVSDLPEASHGFAASAGSEPSRASAEDRALAEPARAPTATRRPAPIAPDAPEPPHDSDSSPAPDDPRDFERPAEAARRAPWAPPL
jgi:hypothetical protein